MRREWHWSIGNVGISTSDWFSVLKIFQIIHTIYFILHFLYLTSDFKGTNFLLATVSKVEPWICSRLSTTDFTVPSWLLSLFTTGCPVLSWDIDDDDRPKDKPSRSEWSTCTHRRNPRLRWTVARGTVARSRTPDWTRRKSLWGTSRWAHDLWRRSFCFWTQCTGLFAT